MIKKEDKFEPICNIGDYLWVHYPQRYVDLCNKFFGGSVRVVKE